MSTDLERDVMQVCLRGHVITDAFASHPELGSRYCERCGAPTLSRCPTCGQDLPGAAPLPGLATIGRRVAPEHCPGCGAPLPWAGRAVPSVPPPTAGLLEQLLRRLPAAVRQLRERHGGRPTLHVRDQFDLEDLLRAALHLQFEDVRRLLRTPRYATGTRTDFVVGPDRVALTAKLAADEARLASELQEDVAYYEGDAGCSYLVVFVYDAAHVLPDPRQFEAAYRNEGDGLDVHCVVAT